MAEAETPIIMHPTARAPEVKVAESEEASAAVSVAELSPIQRLKDEQWGKVGHTSTVTLGTRRHPGCEVRIMAKEQPTEKPDKQKVSRILTDTLEAVKRGDLDRAFEP